jgi:hypothetical protein
MNKQRELNWIIFINRGSVTSRPGNKMIFKDSNLEENIIPPSSIEI